ncbi:RES domain-containing protein [Mesorhizobium sp. B3-1-6]|uniref:RES family NAD+ phosphorylase n=1 Tax=Mesorhizobium sp. B3-1-6 TaxID=2589895 RepID=UPI001128401A|nr:RES family NAD+ phosphorylase [Mesorhizobium sp. B3-1-6]TPI34204.1 RES domain-containing protein [Mesorhizobium sp. B3-1-6]
MIVGEGLLASQTKTFEFSSYVRIIPSFFQATPLGYAAGVSRFGGTKKNFAVLYAARNLATALAETVVRDRYESIEDRRLFISELADRSAVQLDTIQPLRVVDLRKGGCLKLGVSTDIAGAKCFNEAQQFADLVYKDATIDGILYASRLAGENCIAVFDRAITSHLAERCIAPLTQLGQIGTALKKLNVKLVR